MGFFKTRFSNLRNPKTALSILLQLSIVLLSVSAPLLYPQTANATPSLAYVRFDRQSATAALSGTVCLESSLTSQGDNAVVVTFPSTFSLVTTGWTVDTSVNNLPNTARGDAFTGTAWPGITGPALVSTASNAAFFVATQLTSASTNYCFHFTATGSTVGTAGNNLTGTVITVKQPTAATIENFGYATSITSNTNGSGEQIVVTASVSGQFTFSLSATGGGSSGTASASLPLGVLSASNVTTAPFVVTATVTTNAHNGWLSWIKDGEGGLHSDTTGQTIVPVGAYNGTPDDISGGTGGYGVYALSGTNSPTIAPEYIATGNTVGYINNATFYQIASQTTAQTGSTFNIGVKAKPSGSQAPATD
jgi:hypothetical protein